MAQSLDPPETERKSPTIRDIRRYYCEHCGICRSKKALITSHIQKCQKEEAQDADVEANIKEIHPLLYTCEECGVSFRKPAYLKQHVQSHSIEHWIPLENSKMRSTTLALTGLVSGWETPCEDPSSARRFTLLRACYFIDQRPFVCSVNDCHASYRRKDHLTRHLLGHEGKLFTCPVDNCKRQFSYQATMNRHVIEIHGDDDDSGSDDEHPKLYACPEVGCGKVFKYPSRLRKHGKSHAKADDSVTACPEPGCIEYFANKKCLKTHVQTCHLYIECPICGIQQLKKNMKRHQRTHERAVEVGKIRCYFDRCQHVFTNKSNLTAHIKAVHLEERPFACRIAGCGKKFPFKHVRDRHENSGIHAYTPGDFLESDMLFRSSERGGRKRKSNTVDSLLTKRVAPPERQCILDDSSEYLRWLLTDEEEE